MSLLHTKGKRLRAILLNKYVIVFLGFAIFVTFFDEHNLIHRFQTSQKNSEMEDELNFYKEEIKTTKRKKFELQSNKENLEKFAREQYLMKNKDEDIFVIKE